MGYWKMDNGRNRKTVDGRDETKRNTGTGAEIKLVFPVKKHGGYLKMNAIEKKIEKQKSQEPTVQQLKDMVSQLTRENDMLKSANKQAAAAMEKYKSLLAYTIELCHDKEVAILHENAMANAARRNPGIE
jgi:hypothetical protein